MSCPDFIGDGFGSPELASAVAEAVPFMQFAIADTSLPNNMTGRTPSADPIHWLAVNNCGPASKALAIHLEKQGYKVNPLQAVNRNHMLLETEVGEDNVWIDPTALQFLGKYMLNAHNTGHATLDDRSGNLLPSERVLIFPPERLDAVAEWMGSVVRHYWQTKTLAFYEAAGNVSPSQLTYISRIATQIPQDQIEEHFVAIYSPDNFEPYEDFDPETRLHDRYSSMYGRWLNGEAPIPA